MLGTMAEEEREMEIRLDGLLSRIAMETEEIKELEQQLTDGQILANNARQRDLEGVISGLQEHLKQLRQQVDRLQAETQDLQLHLEETQKHCKQLEDTTRTHTQTLQDQLEFSKTQYDQIKNELVQTRIQLEHFKALLLEHQEVSEELGEDRLSLLSSEDELCESVDQLSLAVQESETSRKKLQRVHNHRQDHRAVQEIQQGQNGHTEKNSDCRVQGKLEEIRDNRQTSQMGIKNLQQSLLHSLRHSHQKIHQILNGKLRKLDGSMCDHLRSSINQPGALNHMVGLLHRQGHSLTYNGTQDAGLEMRRHRSSAERGSRTTTTQKPSGWRDSGRGSNSICSSREETLLLLDPGGHVPPRPSDLAPAGDVAFRISHPGETVGRCVCEIEHRKTERLEEKKKKLRQETKELKHTLKQLRCVMQVCEEVQCLEGTLLKRRAELREANRLLLEAQGCVHATKHRADMLLRRAQNSSTGLLEEVEQLRRKKQDEEQDLKEVKEKLRSKNKELERLSIEFHEASGRLTNTLSDCQEAQKHLDSLTCQEEQQRLQRKEEIQEFMKRNEELRNEQQHLQSIIRELKEQLEVQANMSTSSNVKDEQKLIALKAELNLHRTELKQVLQELLEEQKALKVVKTKHKQTLKQLHKKEDELEKKKKDLVKMKDEVESKRKELHDLQQLVESHKEEAELCFKDTKQHQAEMQEVQDELTKRLKERISLNEQCKHLENRRRHADRCLIAVQAELSNLRKELSHTQLLKEGGIKETVANQQQLTDTSKLLSLLSDLLVDKKEPKPGDGNTLVDNREGHLDEHQLLLNHPNEELWDVLKQLLCKAERLKDEREELHQRQEELKEKEDKVTQMKDGLNMKEEKLKQIKEELKGKEDWIKKQKKGLKMREEELNKKEEGLNTQDEKLMMLKEELNVKEEELNMKEEDLVTLKEELYWMREGLLQLKEELNDDEERGVKNNFQEMELKQREKGINEQEGELQVKEGWLNTKDTEKKLCMTDEVKWENEHLEKSMETVFNNFLELSSEEEEMENEPFYLCTTSLKSVFSTEEQRWNTELQREQLRQEEDRLKVHLRCHLWNQQENLRASQLEAEGNLLELKFKLDQLDSLLTHTPPET